MFDYIVNKIVKKYKIGNFNTFFVFGMENENISLIKKFHRFVFENSFFSEENKVFNLTIFRIIQSTIKSLKKFVLIWRLKKAKVASIDTDLLMNSLCNFPSHQKVVLYHDDTLYTFRLCDIINIWLHALSNSINMTPYPKMPKNPFTNVEFHKGHLLKCYICIRFETKFMVPKLIQQFIDCSMDLTIFRQEAFPDLVHKAIDNHIKSGGVSTLYYDCIAMVSKYTRQLNGRKMSEDLLFEKKENAVKILKPVLKKHLYSIRSCNPKIRNKNKCDILDDLKNIFQKHHLLGRKIVRVTKNTLHFVPENVVLTSTADHSDEVSDYTDEDELLTDSNDDSEFDEEEVFLYQNTSTYDDFEDDEDDPVNQVD